MTERGKQIFDAIDQVRRFFEEISKLLSTTEALMSDRSWQRGTSYDQVYSGTSSASYLPRKWMPYELFRFFRREDVPQIMVAVCVLLSDSDEKGRIEEPLISAVAIDYGYGKEIGHWDYWYAGFHKYMTQREANGDISISSSKELESLGTFEFERVAAFAHPLIEIEDAESLEEKIVLPLLEQVEAFNQL